MLPHLLPQHLVSYGNHLRFSGSETKVRGTKWFALIKQTVCGRGRIRKKSFLSTAQKADWGRLLVSFLSCSMLSPTQTVLPMKTCTASCAEHSATHRKVLGASLWLISLQPCQLQDSLPLTLPGLRKDTEQLPTWSKGGAEGPLASSLTLIKLTREVDHKGLHRTSPSVIHIIPNSNWTEKYFPHTYSTGFLYLLRNTAIYWYILSVLINHEKSNYCCLCLDY